MNYDITKKVYIDIYHPVADDEGFPTKDVIHLTAIDINTDIKIGKVVDKLTELTLEYYNDGLYIEAEEFEQTCYLNIFLMFGKEYKFLVEYLYSINIEQIKTASQIKNQKDLFLSVDYLFDENDTEDLVRELNDFGVEVKIHLINRKAFERGAGDYHELIMMSIQSGLVGAAGALGKRLMDKLIDKYDDYQSPRIHKVNTEKVLEFISNEVSINKRDLEIYSVKDLEKDYKEEGTDSDKVEIMITSRYKRVKVIYEKSTKFINYEVIDKTQTMI